MSESNRRPNRDSLVSQLSSTSSSLYPRSTSSSHPESSILPHSLKDRDEDISSFAPRIVNPSDQDPDFDVDDVSYRLRLLVNNNYFLPPAHSKPSPLSFAPLSPNATQKPQKPAAPTFLGFFGIGKAKPKPSPISLGTPSPDAPAPILRTTSDSTSASGHLPRPLPRSLPQTPLHRTYQGPSQAPASRVVVLREKVEDLAAAAKQAEREIRSRGDGRKSQQAVRNNFIDDVIDPTDAVDLPPSADASLFAIQASALNGLGVGDSVGAAVLADRLPPSPGMWSMSTEEDAWRKALLQEAVHHSLTTTPDASFSSSAGPSPSPPEPTSPHSFRSADMARPSDESPISSTPKPARIGQRIMEHGQITAEVNVTPPELSPTSLLYLSPLASPLSPPPETPLSPWRTQEITPLRAETPALTTPLLPPPRRPLANQAYSQSQNDLPTSAGDSDLSGLSDPTHLLRRAVSSPRLSAMNEDEVEARGALMMTPPPINIIPQRRSPISSSSVARVSNTMRTTSSRYTVTTTDSQYSDDDALSYSTPQGDLDEVMPRPSMSLSVGTDNRPSLSVSEYSHPSPTASAFQDALFGSCRSPSPLTRRSHASSLEGFVPSASPPPPRSATFSPPPRASSSLGPTILSPPPRSPATKPVYRPSLSSGNSNSSLHSAHSSTPLPSVSRLTATTPLSASTSYHSLPSEPEGPQTTVSSTLSISPSTSQQQPPLAERRGHGSALSLLRIPTDNVSPAIHSAPAPASPTAFFDRIQSHPNAMDDLETSDESDDEDVPQPPPLPPLPPMPPIPATPISEHRQRTRAISSTGGACSRPSLMRLGNHSSPHLSPGGRKSGESSGSPSFDLVDRSPVGNVPHKGTFFASRKKAMKGKAGFIDPDTLSMLSQRSSSRAPFGGSDEGHGQRSGGDTGSTHSRESDGKRRPMTADAEGSGQGGTSKEKVKTWQRESLQKFDGIVLQHLAAEKDTIKRITTNLSGSRS